MAYELFTGQKPFTASEVIALGFKHLTEQPLSPQTLNPHLPAHMNQALLRALSKERKQRFQDILFFVNAMHTPTKTSQQWLQEGYTLKSLKRYEEAVEAYQQTIRLHPTNALAYYNMGNTLNDLKRYEKALNAYQQAIRLNPVPTII